MSSRLTLLRYPVRFLILCAFILTIAGCSNVKNIRPDAITPNLQPTLTIMTFNIRHGCGRENWGNTSSGFFKGCTKKYDGIIATIRSVDPDVVGLQEISSGQAGLIAKALNMNYSYSSHNSSGYGSWWGNAVLSKFKILEAKKVAIGGSAGKNRSMILAISLVNDTPVIFASIHTDHRLRDDRSIKRILNYLDSVTNPAVLIGDFNMGPQSPQANSLTEGTGILDTAGSPGYGEMGTWASPTGQRIDFVFVQSKYFNVLNSALVTAEHQLASDHIAYYTTVELK